LIKYSRLLLAVGLRVDARFQLDVPGQVKCFFVLRLAANFDCQSPNEPESADEMRCDAVPELQGLYILVDHRCPYSAPSGFVYAVVVPYVPRGVPPSFNPQPRMMEDRSCGQLTQLGLALALALGPVLWRVQCGSESGISEPCHVVLPPA